MNYKKYLIAKIILLSLLVAAASFARASGSASINLLPQSGSFNVGQTFSTVISINPGSEKIDMVRAKLTYPADLLEIKSFSISPVFSYQAGSNAFDNISGTFSWGAGTPGGIQKTSNLGTITFLVKKSGTGKIAMSQDSLALSSGENKFNGQSNSAAYTLVPVVAVQKPVVKKANPVVKNSDNTPAVQPVNIEQDSPVETKIVSNKTSSNFVASILNWLPFGTALRLWIIIGILLAAVMLGMLFYKIIGKPILNSKGKK